MAARARINGISELSTLVFEKKQRSAVRKLVLVCEMHDFCQISQVLCTGTIDLLQSSSPDITFNWLADLADQLSLNTSLGFFPRKEDKEAGFKLFAELIYCSWESKMAVRFLERLLRTSNVSTKSLSSSSTTPDPPTVPKTATTTTKSSSTTTFPASEPPPKKSSLGTLLLATINTIQGDSTREVAVWAGFRNFYPFLERELGLEHGKILLALASPAELQALLDRDWPYLDSHRQAVDACLQEGDCVGISNATQTLTASQASVLFSPHLLESEEGLPPFSLIPFCAYQGQLDLLGQNVSHFPTMSVCSQSSPTIVDGMLCHTLAPSGLETKQGEEYGAVFMIDGNPVTSDPNLLEKYVSNGNEENTWKSDDSASRNEAEVYIPTLSRFKGPARGHFSLTGLKRISATRTVLEQIGSSGGCSLQSFDECHEEIFHERLSKECGCIPFSLSFGQPHQVGFFFAHS